MGIKIEIFINDTGSYLDIDYTAVAVPGKKPIDSEIAGAACFKHFISIMIAHKIAWIPEAVRLPMAIAGVALGPSKN
jgi:hypothetical protein